MGAEGVKSEAAVGADEDALETSRRDARVLLWFATRDGKKVGETVLQNIVTADSDLRDKERTSGNEAKFWTAYRDLAAAVKPASVESILSTCEHPFGDRDPAGKKKLGNARKTKDRYTGGSVSVLIILLLIQTYWFVVTAFSANLEKHRDELDGIAGALRVMNVLAEEMRQDPQIQNLEQIKPSQETPDTPQTVRQEQESPDKPQEKNQKFVNNPQLLDSIKNSIETLLANNSMLAALVLTRDPTFQLTSIGSLDLENKRYRTQRLMAMIQNEKAVLQEPWKVLWYLVMAPTDQEDNKYTNDKQDLTARGSMDEERKLKREREYVGAQFQDDLKKEQLKIGEIIADENLERVLSQSKSIPTILSRYILPML